MIQPRTSAEKQWRKIIKFKGGNRTMKEVEDLIKQLEKKGWKHHLGQPMCGTGVDEIHHFIKGNALLNLMVEQEADKDTVEAIDNVGR